MRCMTCGDGGAGRKPGASLHTRKRLSLSVSAIIELKRRGLKPYPTYSFGSSAAEAVHSEPGALERTHTPGPGRNCYECPSIQLPTLVS